MATATFKLNGLTIPALIQKVRDTVVKLVANVATYATPNPPAATITTQVDALEDSYQAAINGGKDKKELMYLDKQTLLQSMSTLLAYIQSVSGGDAAKNYSRSRPQRPAQPCGHFAATVKRARCLRKSFGRNYCALGWRSQTRHLQIAAQRYAQR
jgi:hypothetical protein